MSELKTKKVYDSQKRANKKYQQTDAYKEYKKAYRKANRDKYKSYSKKHYDKLRLMKKQENNTETKDESIIEQPIPIKTNILDCLLNV